MIRVLPSSSLTPFLPFVLDVRLNRSVKPAPIRCWMPLLDINSWNSFEVNWAPLSLTTVFGIPNLANTVRNFSMVRAEVVVSIRKISGHFVEASAITNNIFLPGSIGPAKSACRRSHGVWGVGQVESFRTAGEFRTARQHRHSETTASNCSSKPGHQT